MVRQKPAGELLRILIIGTSTEPERHTSGFNIGYQGGFLSLGCYVVSISHKEIKTHPYGDYDLILLRDTTVNIEAMKDLAKRGEHFAVFTHAEFNQGKRDIEILRALDPEVIFLDQPLGGYVFKGLPIPCIFLGYGANHSTWMSSDKDIDVLWVGHGYPARQQEVINNVFPLKELSGYNVKIYGGGQPDGPLGIPEMITAMAHARIVIHIGSPIVTDRGGYGGRRIYDALASGCYVVSTWSPLCKQIFPVGVKFCGRNDVYNTVSNALNQDWEYLMTDIEVSYHWARTSQMIAHKCQAMLEAVGL